jgi:integrase
METLNSSGARRVPWNKGRLTGQTPPLKLREFWAIRTRLQMSTNARELAMFNLVIDSKLRACDLTRLQVQDVCMGGHVVSRATFMQQKTQRPVQFEITELTRQSVAAWISARGLTPSDYPFPSRLHTSAHVSKRQYARIVHRWVASIGLDDAAYSTHTMRRTKVPRGWMR